MGPGPGSEPASGADFKAALLANIREQNKTFYNVVVATAFHPSGQWVATGGGEHKEILLWQIHTGTVLARLEGTGRTIYAVGFSPDGRYLSWGHTAIYTSPNHQGPLEHHFDLTQLTRLPRGLSDASPVQALERLGTLSLVFDDGRTEVIPVDGRRSHVSWSRCFGGD